MDNTWRVAATEESTMTQVERQQFLEERRTMIGGSDAASVLNVGYGCRRRLVMQKRGVTPDFDIDSPQMERGRVMEPIIAGCDRCWNPEAQGL